MAKIEVDKGEWNTLQARARIGREVIKLFTCAYHFWSAIKTIGGILIVLHKDIRKEENQS